MEIWGIPVGSLIMVSMFGHMADVEVFLSNLSCLIVLESSMNYITHQPQDVTGPCHMF